MALAETLDPAEHLAYWIDEGTTPSAPAEVWRVAQRFSQDDELALESGRSISAMAIDGRFTINDDQGYVRVTLIDTELREHLVAEFYPLMTGQESLTLDGVCRESCLLGRVTPHRLRIDLEGATLRIARLHVLAAPNSPIPGLADRQYAIRHAQASAIVGRVNEQIALYDLGWEAGVTEYALQRYEARKVRSPSGDEPAQHGFEYYVDGVYQLPQDLDDTGGAPGDLIVRFDWRKRHGANRPTSPYYDGQAGPSGWMTPVTRQTSGCWDCWAHAAIGLLEGHINLVLNRHRDINLSEQKILSCSGAGDCGGGSLLRTLRYLVDEGAVTEKCFPYRAADSNCGLACSNPLLKVRVARMLEIVEDCDHCAYYDAKIKRALLDHGPLVFKRDDKWHYMVLVGFDRDARTGRTIWIVKNSWGEDWGNYGFGQIFDPLNNLCPIYAVQGVELRYRGRVVRSSCRDEDGDGYSVWGFGLPRPRDCPSRDGLPDCNDNSPNRGPMLANGRCALIEDQEPEPSTGGGQDGPSVTPGTAVVDGGGGGAGGLLVLLGGAWLTAASRHRCLGDRSRNRVSPAWRRRQT